ncbi:hypothetical protein [Rhodococcus sp. NPDC058639]|uniref:hypothetical protein n=1 Tax=Rhodococcus sp. NPDC058639 TaxID=3346570 RepID=UPI0036649186
MLAEVALLIRIGSTVFVVQRLQGRPAGTTTVFAAVGLALLASVVVVVKIALTHRHTGGHEHPVRGGTHTQVTG